MKLFWQKANTTIRWKLQVLNAIVRSKLLYGLERIQLTKADISRLNAFQNKALRRILGKPPTFLDRQATSESIYREIRDQHRCHFEHFGKSGKCGMLRLFGHVLRSPPSDPMKQASLAADGLRPRATPRRRSGRPRADWITESYRDAYEILFPAGAPFDPSDLNQSQRARNQAQLRLPPFG